MTDTTTVYMLLAVAGGMLTLALVSMYQEGVNIISVALMFIPAVISWLVSNLYVDGTLTDTSKFLSSNDSIMTMTNVVRDPATSQIFQLIGIVLFFGTLLQIYSYFKATRTLSEFDVGDEED